MEVMKHAVGTRSDTDEVFTEDVGVDTGQVDIIKLVSIVEINSGNVGIGHGPDSLVDDGRIMIGANAYKCFDGGAVGDKHIMTSLGHIMVERSGNLMGAGRISQDCFRETH